MIHRGPAGRIPGHAATAVPHRRAKGPRWLTPFPRCCPTELGVSMTAHQSDRIMQITERVTYCFSESGYAFVEDDQVEALADALASFLQTAGIPIQAQAAVEGRTARRATDDGTEES